MQGKQEQGFIRIFERRKIIKMIYPPIDELITKVDSRYTLVVETAKRARQLVSGSEPKSTVKSGKPVTTAVQEIYEGKVTYKRTREGIK
jgi:DNA-directed RNA polymerase subunit omega